MEKILTRDQFIAISKRNHKFEYDYSFVPEEVKLSDRVIPICKKHGVYDHSVLVSNFIYGQECNKCVLEQRTIDSLSPSKSKKFFDSCKKKHQNSDGTPKYIYNENSYKGNNEPIDVYCPIHDYWWHPIARMHKFGRGCKYCGYDSMKKNLTLTQENVIERLRKLFPNFTFEKTIYKESKQYVTITCPEHGDFEQLIYSALQGKCGCKECANNGTSILEKEIINYLKSICSDNIETNNRELLKPKELDIYIPSKKLAIEFDGLYWHSEYNRDKNYHIQKTIECEKKGIRLIHIFEDEWLEKRSIVQSRLKQLLGLQTNKYYARKCLIRQVQTSEEREFFNNNHIQGYIGSNICYGLYYKDTLVACMSFGQLRKNLGMVQKDSVYEMYRFACLKNCRIIGGASKLFKHFLKQINPKQIISFADRRWSVNSENNLYRKLGFEFLEYTVPNYYYIDNYQRRFNRFSFRKDILVSKYNANPLKTESEITFEMGLVKIYDSGSIKYIYNNNSK